MSASEPTAIVPFFGKSPNIFAAAVDVNSTNRFKLMRPCSDAAVVDQAHPVLDAGAAIRNLAEVIATELLLFLETERTMIGRDHLQVIASQAAPQHLLIRLCRAAAAS